MHLLVQVLVILVTFLNCVWADKLQLEQKILNDIFSGYDKAIRPNGENGTGPVVVEVNAYVRTLYDFDDLKMMYTASLTFRQTWRDERLKYDSNGVEYVTLTSPDRMWTPDIFFSNERKGHFHKILAPNYLIRIYPDGFVLFSTRISLELSCPMNLRSYPLDNQICSIVAASYGYTTNDIVFKWRPGDPVQVTRNLHLAKFSLNRFFTDYCTSRTNTGEYSCIMVTFELSRAFTFYMLQTFMPTMALVILSWITFWVHPRAIVLRLGIWIGVLISTVIVTTSIADSSPSVSYVKAIDIWMGTCIVFVFSVLIEISLVNNAVTKEDTTTEMKALEEANKTMGVDDVKNNSDKLAHYTSRPLKWLNKYSTQAQRIDAVSRFLFPAAFAFFNFVFWITYASG